MASFKTAWEQREIVMDVAVKGTVNVGDIATPAAAKAYKIRITTPESLAAIMVGDLVVLTPEALVYTYSEMEKDTALSYTTKVSVPTTVTAESEDYITVGEAPADKYYKKVSTEVPAYIARTLSLAAATHIVAQSDVTMENGHVPIERRDYRYFPTVNGTFAVTVAGNTPIKKVALFAILNKYDVEIDESQSETA